MFRFPSNDAARKKWDEVVPLKHKTKNEVVERGARRGGRGRGRGALTTTTVEAAGQPARGGGSGVRVSGGGRGRERPSAHDLVTFMLETIPEGRPLETPLHRKQKRYLPSTSRPRYLECGGSDASTPTTHLEGGTRKRTTQHDVNPAPECIAAPVAKCRLIPTLTSSSSSLVRRNYGSEEDSDEDYDEDSDLPAQPCVIPRVARPYLDFVSNEEMDVTPQVLQDATMNFSWPSVSSSPLPSTSSNLPPQLSSSCPRPFSSVPSLPSTPVFSPPATRSRDVDKFSFQWRSFPQAQIQPELRREPFSDINCGPTVPLASPYDAFTAIWDREIMEHIAIETNAYAQQLAVSMLEEGTICISSRITKWYDTDADDLYVYLATVMATSIVIKTRLEEYWNISQDMFITPGFSASMSINLFLLLSRCIHFQNNERCDPESMTRAQAKLFKVQPILDHLNNKFSQ